MKRKCWIPCRHPKIAPSFWPKKKIRGERSRMDTVTDFITDISLAKSWTEPIVDESRNVPAYLLKVLFFKSTPPKCTVLLFPNVPYHVRTMIHSLVFALWERESLHGIAGIATIAVNNGPRWDIKYPISCIRHHRVFFDKRSTIFSTVSCGFWAYVGPKYRTTIVQYLSGTEKTIHLRRCWVFRYVR